MCSQGFAAVVQGYESLPRGATNKTVASGAEYPARGSPAHVINSSPARSSRIKVTAVRRKENDVSMRLPHKQDGDKNLAR